MAMHEDDRDRVSRQGTEAWRRLKREKNWNDWLKVGEALLVGRDWAMNQATTNQPQGKAYNMAFGEWLQRYKLDDMDKGDRSRLFQVMENLPMIEDWRRTLTLNQKLSLNHPNAVLRRWKAHMAPEPRTKTGEPKPTLRDSVANLSEANDAKDREIADLKAHVAELEAARRDEPRAAEGQQPLSAIEAFTVLIGHMSKGGFDDQFVFETLVAAKPAFDAAQMNDLSTELRYCARCWGKIEKQSAAAARRKDKAKSKDRSASGALKWKDDGDPLGGSSAPAARGIYTISVSQHFPSGAFAGYTVAHLPEKVIGGKRGERRIKDGIKDLDKAKAIAQADHDRGADA
jgi:hypothetical protein